MQTVDALVCPRPGRLRLERRTAPQAGPGEALVRPRRIGVCGTDYHIFEGKHPFLEYPRVMGHELAVEVVEAPAGASLAAGDQCVVNPYLSCGRCVACRRNKPNCCVDIAVLGVHRDGGMTGLMPVPVENLLPADGLTLDQCAAVEFLSIGAHAVRRGGVGEGDRVLVVGAGPIGLGVLYFSRMAGAEVLVLDRDRGRAETARSLVGGVEIASADDDTGLDDGFDVTFDATGNRGAMERGFGFVAHGGSYVLVSVVKETVTFSDPDFHRKETTLLGSRNATSLDFASVMDAVRRGDIPVDRLITHRTDLAGAADAIPAWAKDKTGLIKAMIEIDG